MYKGIGNNCGIQIGKVYKYYQPNIEITKQNASPIEELDKLSNSLNKTLVYINSLKEKACKIFSDKELAVFDAYITMANDPDYIGKIKDYINKGLCASYSIDLATNDMVSMFKDIKDEYFNERISDIKHVENIIICNLFNVEIPNLSLLEEVIVVAKELKPQDTAQINKDKVLGFICEKGSKTSHASILAESLKIPSVVGIDNIFDILNDDDTVIVDSIDEEIIINPDEETINKYLNKKKQEEQKIEKLKSLINEDTYTKDNHRVMIGANIGSSLECIDAIENGAEFVGLFRTEFLFINRNGLIPSEDEQFNLYKDVVDKMNNKKVIFRTLDVGGDKELDYFDVEYDENGMYSAIDYCLKEESIFKSQIRALLKASAYGNLAIMFPMISKIDEFIKAKEFILKQKEELVNEGFDIKDIEIGMMVETKEAATNAYEFAKIANFFSIGTNDLIMYTLGVDRLHDTNNYLLNPDVLTLIKNVVEGAHKNNIKCGVCGELAGDKENVNTLIGLGVDSLSMSPYKILPIKSIVQELSFKEEKEKII